jgi:subtilase-type serine protease
MRLKRRPAISAERMDIAKRPTLALAHCRLASTAIAVIFAAPSSAIARVSPGYDPSRQYGWGLIGAPAAWKLGSTGAGVAIAVGDTHITTNQNPEPFMSNIDLRSMNFAPPNQGAPYDPKQITDLVGYGTHSAGVVLASSTSRAPGIASFS